MTCPMLADSGDERLGLAPLRKRFAGDAILYANDLHNSTPASGALVGSTSFEGCWGRGVTLGAFRRFGCRVWVHQPGEPFLHRQKFAERAQPGSFMGFERPFGSGVYKVLLDSSGVTQSQTVVFDDAPFVPPPALLFLRRKGSSSYWGHQNLKDPGSQRLCHPCQC
jgi:hypothetical protein